MKVRQSDACKDDKDDVYGDFLKVHHNSQDFIESYIANYNLLEIEVIWPFTTFRPIQRQRHSSSVKEKNSFIANAFNYYGMGGECLNLNLNLLWLTLKNLKIFSVR